MSRARKGPAGHKDRKPITQTQIARPIARGARQAYAYGGVKGGVAYLKSLEDWQLRRLHVERPA